MKAAAHDPAGCLRSLEAQAALALTACGGCCMKPQGMKAAALGPDGTIGRAGHQPMQVSDKGLQQPQTLLAPKP